MKLLQKIVNKAIKQQSLFATYYYAFHACALSLQKTKVQIIKFVFGGVDALKQLFLLLLIHSCEYASQENTTSRKFKQFFAFLG